MNLWCMPGWPGVSYVDQDGLRLTEAIQPLTSECWDQKCVPSCLESLAFYFYTTTCKASKGIWPEDLCSGSTVFNNCDIIHNTDCRFLCSFCECSFILPASALFLPCFYLCSKLCVRESSMLPLRRTRKDRQMRMRGSLWLFAFSTCAANFPSVQPSDSHGT